MNETKSTNGVPFLAVDPNEAWKGARTWQAHCADCGTWMRIASEHIYDMDGNEIAIHEGTRRCVPCGSKRFLGVEL
jgi:DNA-directed RNA polymerase subunit RPC12/RpoP